MRTVFIASLLWLGCTSAALAGEPAPSPWTASPETLTYDVGWGPLPLGRATLAYQPEGAAYGLTAHVEDSSIFIDLDDTWHAAGKANGWASQAYTAKQKENDYRADKRVTFRYGKKGVASGGTATYENFIGQEPSQTIVLPAGARDVLSTLYNLRAQGLSALQQPRQVPVMGLKRVGLLDIRPVVVAPGREAGETPVWLLEMLFDNQNPAKPRTDTWKIWLADDGRLTPIKIEAKVKLGTFTARLRK
jgi:hypothetical protein